MPLLTIPSSDTNLMLFVNNENQLSSFYCLMGDKYFNDYRADVAHKYLCYEQLQKSSKKHTIQSFNCKDSDSIKKISENINYPAVYKP